MDYIKLAIQWAIGNPWLLLGLLIGVGILIRLIGKRSGYRRNASSAPLLRSRREQKRFSHLTTIYTPKAYRREKTPKK